MEGKRHDFIKNLEGPKTAEHVIQELIKVAKEKNIKVGAQTITPLPNGLYKVHVELTYPEDYVVMDDDAPMVYKNT